MACSPPGWRLGDLSVLANFRPNDLPLRSRSRETWAQCLVFELTCGSLIYAGRGDSFEMYQITVQKSTFGGKVMLLGLSFPFQILLTSIMFEKEHILYKTLLPLCLWSIQCGRAHIYKQILLAMIIMSLGMELEFLIINHHHNRCQGCSVTLRTAVWWCLCCLLWVGDTSELVPYSIFIYSIMGVFIFILIKSVLITASYNKAFTSK